jgi:hypothetical protein
MSAQPQLVELTDGQEMTVLADAVITEPSGAVRFTAADGSTILLIAARVWRSVRVADVGPLPQPTGLPGRSQRK